MPETHIPTSPASMADEPRLRRLSHILGTGCLVLAVGVPLLVGWSWFGADPVERLAETGLPALTQAAPWQVAVSGLLTLMPALLASVALLAARRCFTLFRRGCYMSADVVTALKGFGGWACVASLVAVMVPTLVGLLMTLNNPVGSRILVLSVETGPVMGLLFGGTLWVIAAVMAHAVAIAEDHAQIV